MIKKLLSQLSPILGAGAIGVCPLCWAGSASLLTYIGLGVLIPVWQWIVFVFLAIGLIGFIFDYKSHKNIKPILLLILGGLLLYVGRYMVVNWAIWGLGIVLVVVAVMYNKKIFKK